MNIVETLGTPSAYRDKKYPTGLAALEKDLQASTTLYVGNLSFYTSEEQIIESFSKVGEIKRIIMGLDRVKKTPCGFCFVEYYTRKACLDAQKFLNETKVDERSIRTDVDPGFKEGRQYGRGSSGGQVRDEFRDDYDEGRGGWGSRRTERVQNVYDGDSIIPKGSLSYSSYSQYQPSYSKPKRDREDDDEYESRSRFRNQ